MMNIRTLLCFATVFMTANAVAVVKLGECPQVVGQSSLDVQRYLGKWYEYVRFPAIFEAGLQCTSANYDLNNDGSIAVTNQGFNRITIFGKTYVVRNSTVNGNAVVVNTDRPAELNVAFFGPNGDTPNYIVQETDYVNYSVVYSCSTVLGINIQYSWILTRERGVAPSNLDELYKNLTDAGVDVSKYFVVDQSDCPQ